MCGLKKLKGIFAGVGGTFNRHNEAWASRSGGANLPSRWELKSTKQTAPENPSIHLLNVSHHPDCCRCLEGGGQDQCSPSLSMGRLNALLHLISSGSLLQTDPSPFPPWCHGLVSGWLFLTMQYVRCTSFKSSERNYSTFINRTWRHFDDSWDEK